MANSGALLVVGIVVILLIAIAVADHIRRADVVEFQTPYYSLRSQHNRNLPS